MFKSASIRPRNEIEVRRFVPTKRWVDGPMPGPHPGSKFSQLTWKAAVKQEDKDKRPSENMNRLQNILNRSFSKKRIVDSNFKYIDRWSLGPPDL